MIIYQRAKKHPGFKKYLIAGSIAIISVIFISITVVSNIVAEAASLIGIQKMAEEKYKQANPVPDIKLPRDLLQEYYIPASIEFGIPWSTIAGIHAVQTEFARNGGIRYRDAFNLPNEFWDKYKISRREHDWQKQHRTQGDLENRVPYKPERGRLEDVIWTVAKFIGQIDNWNSRDVVYPVVNEITKLSADTEKAMQFAWAYRFQFSVNGTLLSLDPSALALGLIPPEYMELYREVEAEFEVPWNYLAAIHYIESRFGTYVNPITKQLMVSEAGALGHFQFMPGTWAAYGLDRGGGKDPFHVVDAAYSAANYLIANGFLEDVDKALFAYNRSWSYVESVKAQASLFAQSPVVGIGDFVIPVANPNLTSGFGPRPRPCPSCSNFHKGLDFAGPIGTPIFAYAAGTVTYAGRATGFGTLITIDHGNGMQTRYAHSSRLFVSTGQVVSAGYPIAAMGNEGNSTGSHLHFEILINGRHVDPYPYLFP